MRDFIDVTGKTEDEAIKKALAQLNLDRFDVSVEVLERAKSGFLGIGAAPAKVRVYYGEEEEVVIPAPVVTEKAEKPQQPRKEKKKPAEKTEKVEKPVEAPKAAEKPVEVKAEAPKAEKPAQKEPSAGRTNISIVGTMEQIEDAKMIGITPVILTLRGRVED